MKRITCLLIVLASAASAQTQARTQAEPQFEVASIRPSGPQSIRGSDGGPGHKDPTRYSFGQATMQDLIATAWGVKYFQMSSPTPLDRDKFDLVANIPPGATKEQFRVMLQNLLKDRFNLKAHIESKEFPAWEMVVAKTGLKMKEAIPGETPSQPGAPPARPVDERTWPEFPPNVARMAAQNTSSEGYWLVRLKSQLEPISMLAGMLEVGNELPIVDKTGLTGNYSFTLEYTKDTPGSAPDSPPPAPALPTALQQQLGLQLVSKKLPFDVVVVESFNRTPTEN